MAILGPYGFSESERKLIEAAMMKHAQRIKWPLYSREEMELMRAKRDNPDGWKFDHASCLIGALGSLIGAGMTLFCVWLFGAPL